MNYALAPDGIFWSFQSEGRLRQQMAFIRLAGCSVDCPLCDTNYTVASRASADQIASRANIATPTSVSDRWAWITGGEPADRDLEPLIVALRRMRFAIAVATSGHKPLPARVDWLSVSPHDPGKWVQTHGHEVKVVPGLNGYDIESFARVPHTFWHRYVQPLWDPKTNAEDPESLKTCIAWVKHNPTWALSRQDHKGMGLP